MTLITIPAADVVRFERGSEPVHVYMNGERASMTLQVDEDESLLCWGDERRQVVSSHDCEAGRTYIGVEVGGSCVVISPEAA